MMFYDKAEVGEVKVEGVTVKIRVEDKQSIVYLDGQEFTSLVAPKVEQSERYSGFSVGVSLLHQDSHQHIQVDESVHEPNQQPQPPMDPMTEIQSRELRKRRTPPRSAIYGDPHLSESRFDM